MRGFSDSAPENTCGCKYNHLDNSGQREQKGARSVNVRVTAPRVRERHRPGEYADRVLGRLAGSILQLAYAVASTIWPIHMDAKVSEGPHTWLHATHPKDEQGTLKLGHPIPSRGDCPRTRAWWLDGSPSGHAQGSPTPGSDKRLHNRDLSH